MASDIAWALADLRAREVNYTRYTDYYRGIHRLSFATDKFRDAFGVLLSAFADNLCKTVVNTLADRLQVTGFASDREGKQPAIDAWDMWQANRMDRRSGEVHTEALRCGDGFLIVWPGPDGAPRMIPQKAAQIVVEYDSEEPGVLVKAAKCWLDNFRRWRLNLYYPDRIEKYATPPPAMASEVTYTAPLPWSEGAFTEYQEPNEPWPVPNLWGKVPVFHFANDADVGELGQSELESVIPLQDGLNKAVCDMMVAMEFVALPQRWATGLEVEIDSETGKPLAPFIPGADRVWTAGAPDVRFGQFDAANLAQFISVQESFRKEIGLVSMTPLHYIHPVNYPSGEAMKAAEAPLVSKARDRAIAFGNVWEDAIAFAMTIAGKPANYLSCLWSDPQSRNDKASIDVQLGKKELGVSQRQNLRELGYSDEQIETMESERREEQQALGETMLAAFDRDRLAGSRPGEPMPESEPRRNEARD